MKAIHVSFLMFISFCAQGYASDQNPYDVVHTKVMQHIFGEQTELPKINTPRYSRMLSDKDQEERKDMVEIINKNIDDFETTPLSRTNLAIWYAERIGRLTQQQVNILREVHLTHTVTDLKALLFWLPNVNYLCHVAQRVNPTNPLTHFELILFALDADNLEVTDHLSFLQTLFRLFEVIDKRSYLEEYYCYTRGISGTKKIVSCEQSMEQTNLSIWQLLQRLLGKLGTFNPNPYECESAGIVEQQRYHQENAINALVKLAILNEAESGFINIAMDFIGFNSAERLIAGVCIPYLCWGGLVTRLHEINRVVYLLNQQGVERENLFGYLITIEHKEKNFSNIYYIYQILLSRQHNYSNSIIANISRLPDLKGDMHFPVQRTEECATGGLM